MKIRDIYHPSIAYCYEISLQISFALTALATIPAIYVIATQSKNAKMFRFILINQILWSFLFCAIYSAEGNVPLFPIPAVYFVGILKSWIPKYMSFIIPVHLFISLGHTQSYFLACIYRVSYASAFNRFQKWFEDPRKLEILMIGLLLIFSVIIVGPFIFTPYNAIELREELFEDHQILERLSTQEPSIIAAPLIKFPSNSTSLLVALNAYSIYIPFTFCAGFVIYLIFLKQAFTQSNFLSQTTHRNCMIVVRAKSVQMFSVFVFLFLPFLIQFIVFLLKIKNGSKIALLAHFPPSYHLLIEILALFYFIKPYREFWKRMGRRIKGIFSGKSMKRKYTVSEATKHTTVSSITA